MKKKYYAVRVGKTTGIFKTWEECRESVDGVPNSVYQGFATKKEALAYLGDGQKAEEETIVCPPGTAIAYVDGSYDAKTKRYAYGCVLFFPDGETLRLNGAADKEEARTARNVAGELLGTMVAIRQAASKGYRNIIIRHDYSGIAAWYNGTWKAESYCACAYLEFVKPYRSLLNISFEKVPAHTGIRYNEEADLLAKEALGLKKD